MRIEDGFKTKENSLNKNPTVTDSDTDAVNEQGKGKPTDSTTDRGVGVEKSSQRGALEISAIVRALNALGCLLFARLLIGCLVIPRINIDPLP